MADLGDVVIRLRADTGEFTSRMRDAETGIRRLETSGVGSARGIHIMRSALFALGTQATGLPPALARITEGMLLFGAGNAVVLAAVAGLAAIGLAMKKMGEEATTAKKAVDDLNKVVFAKRAPSETAEIQVGLARQQLASIERQQAAANERLRQARLFGQETDLTRKIEEQLYQLELKRLHVIGLIRGLRGGPIELPPVTIEAVAGGGPYGQVVTGPLAQRGNITPGMQGIPTPEQVIPLNFQGIGGEVGKNLRKMQSDLAPLVEQIGRDLGRQFIEAFTGGMFDFRSFFKSVLSAILDYGISKGVASIFGGGPVAAALGGGGQSLSGVVKTEAAGGGMMSFPATPAMIHPYDAARMAEWQQTFRETALVARSQGFRG